MKFTLGYRRKRQVIGFLIGVLLSTLGWVYLVHPSNEKNLSLGPLNTGHEDLKCAACHTPAEGSVVGQAKDNFLYAVGSKEEEVVFGSHNVDSKKCQGCHDRPNDRHPIHRFKEPRFNEARDSIQPTECESCHLEHNGVRLTIETTGFCVHCHQETKLKKDPLDVSHEELIKQKKWNTCLQCHDFHGNHFMETAESLKDTIPSQRIWKYIEGGEDPYSSRKKYMPKEDPEDKLIINKKKKKK